MPAWDAILAPTVPLLELFVRGTVTFLALTVLIRIVGRRESGGLGITDLLVVVLVADAAGLGLAGGATSVTDSLLLVVVVLFWSVVLDAVAYRSPRLAALLKSRPRPLIQHGELNRRLMRREFMTDEEVRSQLRLQGIEEVDQVERAYLEPNGMISVIPRGGAPTRGAPEPPPRAT